ncbi:efflux RND transporter periplasmic adaptor subunit [Martelella mediterranea]|uniref:RND family efflux transporter MFP subunit n=1 Tax=Martelella mediterranea TaxID=293089 RepID=A0A4R3NW92_9HYPH|nr:efflux RND transporter periplasmic adaptor subunit [Martelella mediterranea]TCT44709.1 RND family efflux transporter MFP subunit [Martelella mediterranea]
MSISSIWRGATALGLLLAATAASADTLKIEPVTVPEWKAVYGEVEARNTVPARARIGGTLESLTVTEGDTVHEGDVIATVEDDKLNYQISAYEAQLKGLEASLKNAQSELDRGEQLNRKGALSNQQLETLKTQVDVVTNNIASTKASMAVVRQQLQEGDVIAPASGRVLTVPVVAGSVIQPGETVATIGSGGFYLRLAVPERHADMLRQGATIEISRPTDAATTTGRLVKLYPQLENNRVIADVEVDGLKTGYVNQRFLVRVPIGERQALMVPETAVSTRHGLDFVSIALGNGEMREKTVITGKRETLDGKPMVEVLTGLNPGDEVITP